MEGEWKGNRFVLVIHFEAAAVTAYRRRRRCRRWNSLPRLARQLDNRRNLSYIISSLPVAGFIGYCDIVIAGN